MDRTLYYNVTTEYENTTIYQFLQEQGYSAQSLIQLKKYENGILLNNKWEYMNQKLHGGDILTVNIMERECSENIIPISLPFPVIYEDEDFVVVNKPAGMPIHPSMKNYDNTLANAAAYYYRNENGFVYRCINRLDRDTSGLTILAKHFVSSGMLYQNMAQRKIKREYIAIVEDKEQSLRDSGTIDLPIARKNDSVIERVVDYEKGERAVTHYRVIDRNVGYAVVALQLETGRTHQIRVHMTATGHPLFGDFLYNPGDTHMKRQALHAHRIWLKHPITGENMVLTAPMPQDMMQYIKEESYENWNGI